MEFTVTVGPEELNPYLDAAHKEIIKQMNVPGFHKGYIPGETIGQRIGFTIVAGEIVNDAVPELYSKTLNKRRIRPMAQLEFDVQDVPQSANDETKPKFTATVERRPDIELSEIDSLETATSEPEIKGENVGRRFETLRQRFNTLVGVDRSAAKDGFTSTGLTAETDGETVDSQRDVSYGPGSNTVLDGLGEAPDGLPAGGETTFEGTLEIDEHEGQEAAVKVKANSVKAEELPELNDELASKTSKFDALDGLKADTCKAATQDAESCQVTETHDALIAKLQKDLKISVSEGIKVGMVEEQLKGMAPDPERITRRQKAQAEGTVGEDLHDQTMLDTPAEKLGVRVSQSDVFNFLASIVQQHDMDPNSFIQAIIKNGQLGFTVQEVGRSKDLLTGMCAIKFIADDEIVDPSALLGEAAEDEESESVEAVFAAITAADEPSAGDDIKDAK